VCYFAVSVDTDPDIDLYLCAQDKAGNQGRSSFNYSIRRKQFPNKTMTVSDRFIEKILPDFSHLDMSGAERPVDKFLKINRELRVENDKTCSRLGSKSSAEQFWDGSFIRMRNAATMAGFGDRRVYTYEGKEIDRQTHLGVDLASLANSEIHAANSGRVVFADKLGIYGLTVVLDHGRGISSLYAHLSSIDTSEGHFVERGDVIGFSGQSGLAGGDHLHFSIMVNGVFVNPIEFWDEHWIRDNITKKLQLIRPAGG
jgi:murein DD-endopeptidase MepM/ murein hydrolase activator NlpD